MPWTYIDVLSYSRIASSVFCLIWYFAMVAAGYIGFVEIMWKFKSRPKLDKDDSRKEYEGVTILRPIKGIDPELLSCLESSFCQDYPHNKLQILFCVDDPSDALIPLIKKLISKYPTIDSEILISTNFNTQTNRSDDHYGPNPKVNNLAKGFVSSKYDILWVMDSNVWAASNLLKNSVKTLNENLNNGRKQADDAKRTVKLVHHVPLALSINPSNNKDDNEYVLTPIQSDDDDSEALLSSGSSRKVNSSASSSSTITSGSTTYDDSTVGTSASSKAPIKTRKRFLKKFGAKLDEMFLHTSHSKFYVSLNNLELGPCVNGKSNMYRKSDLDRAVSLIPKFQNTSPFFHTPSVVRDAQYYSSLGPGHSIKFFSRYIGEDNMIGIALWENINGKTGLTGDVVIQPLSGVDNDVSDYIKRRVRWQRVRKYMVLMATLIEPTTESLVCGIFGIYAISTLFLNQWFSGWLFLLHLTIWMLIDYVQYYTLIKHVVTPVNLDYLPSWLENIPPVNRSFLSWLYIWILRELLALPIWIIAMMGHEIDWRGKPFKIKHDLTAEEL